MLYVQILYKTSLADSTSDFIKYVERSMIPNFPVTKADIICTEDIFGSDIRSLQGKATCRKTSQLATIMEDLPTGMLEQHGKVNLVADIMYINEIPFVVTVSLEIHFGTTELIKN